MDLFTPIYHFRPPINWMNDPNGVIQFQDEYHLFYQYNPYKDTWGSIHWGHAKSKDLVHWEHLPIALKPSLELGEHHCFSGCAVIDQGVPKIFYTSIGIEDRNAQTGAQQWMAISDDGMLTWEKPTFNPILTKDLHGDLDIQEWRDPYIWKHNDNWYMVLSGKYNNKGCALLYSSPNLEDWEFVHILAKGSENLWECPNFFPLKDKYILIYSPNDIVRYLVGTWNSDLTFTVEHEGVIDHGGWEGFYAPNSLLDSKNRRIMWGWITENARGQLEVKPAWRGVQSIPRILTLEDNKLKISPAPELEQLRDSHFKMKQINLNKGFTELPISGRALEIHATITTTNSNFSLSVLRSKDGEEETIISFNIEEKTFTIDRTKSSKASQPHKWPLKAPLTLQQDGCIDIRVFIDHSVLEVFINEENCLTTRVYPTLIDSVGVGIFADEDHSLSINRLNIWTMKSIWL